MENYDELYHWGIKGMKWGIRRWQNKDGTLNADGQKRYNKAMAKLDAKQAKIENKKQVSANRAASKAQLNEIKARKQEIKALKKGKLSDQKVPEETIEQRRERVLKSVNPKEIYANKDILTTQELNDRINRIDTEARLAGKIPKEKTTTDKINDALDKINTVGDVAKKVANTQAGKAILKQLGLGEKEFDFNLENFYNNINKKTHKEVEEVSKRVENQNKIKAEYDKIKTARDEENARKKAEKQAAKDAKAKAREDKAKEKEDKAKEKEAKAAEREAKKEAEKEPKKTSKKSSNDDDVFRYEATADDIIGEGTSRRTSTNSSNSTKRGEDVVYEYYSDNDWSNTYTSNLPSTRVNQGRSTVSRLIETSDNLVALYKLLD